MHMYAIVQIFDAMAGLSNCIMVTLIAILIGWIDLAALKDICFGEQSRLSCARGELIMMTSAEYGHMEGGSVLKKSIQDTVDVPVTCFHFLINGVQEKQECNFDTGANDLKKMNINCPKFIIKYTRLHHTCIKVISACSSGRLTDKAGYLSSYFTHKRGCGSTSSPWIIKADPGQIIKLELIDFSSHKQDSHIISCRAVYGFVIERSLGINHTICGGSRRQMTLYTSKTNWIEIQILKNDKKLEGEFLVKYEVIGCAELSPPSNAWYKREGNKAVIGCEDNDKEWTVTCSGNKWEGEIGNCTKSVIQEIPEAPRQQNIAFTSVVIMAGIIGIAVVLSVVAIVIGIVYVKKYKMRQETKRAVLVHKTYSTLDRNIQAYYRPVTMDQSVDNRTLWDIPPSTHPEGQTMSSDDQCTCATLQMRNNIDNDKRTEITSLERQSLYSSIKSN